jgi:hypothetical protein
VEVALAELLEEDAVAAGSPAGSFACTLVHTWDQGSVYGHSDGVHCWLATHGKREACKLRALTRAMSTKTFLNSYLASGVTCSGLIGSMFEAQGCRAALLYRSPSRVAKSLSLLCKCRLPWS